MTDKYIDLEDVEEVAEGLKELKNQMVFVGGAIIGLYADEPGVEEVRPTEDIDMTITLASFRNWYAIQEKLASYGFHPDPFGHAICSYKYNGISVDIMPAEDGPLGPANNWYKFGFDDLRIVKVKATEIQVLPAPCYLATKFEAFNGRGKDYRTSHDFEDIIYVINNRTTLIEEVADTLPDVRAFLQKELKKVLDNPYSEEILSAHISPILLAEQLPILIERIRRILAL